jgi:putative transcriptional regulator
MFDSSDTVAYPVPMTEIVHNCVQDLRTKRGMTQEALAEKIGVSRQTIIAIEKGNYTPSVLLALHIARTFGTPVEAIFTIKK